MVLILSLDRLERDCSSLKQIIWYQKKSPDKYWGHHVLLFIMFSSTNFSVMEESFYHFNEVYTLSNCDYIDFWKGFHYYRIKSFLYFEPF